MSGERISDFRLDRISEYDFHSPTSRESIIRSLLYGINYERFLVFFFESNLALLSLMIIDGTDFGVEAQISEVLSEALNRQAAGVLLAHNHPSGIAAPSPSDKVFTRKLALGLEACDVALLDHYILGGDDLFSFRASNLL